MDQSAPPATGLVTPDKPPRPKPATRQAAQPTWTTACTRLRDPGHLMRIAITGHRGLPAATERLVNRAIREQLAASSGSDLVGVSNLADGAAIGSADH